MIANQARVYGGLFGCALAAAMQTGCDNSDQSTGVAQLNVLLEAEDTITGGLQPGTTGEAIQDGWTVTFDDYIAVVGDIDVSFATDPTVTAEARSTYAVDLKDVPPEGLSLWSLDNLQTGRWEFNYSIRGAADGAMPHSTVTQAQFQEMLDGDLTYLIAGRLTQTGGRSCPPTAFANPGMSAVVSGQPKAGATCYENETIAFRFGVQAETAFGPCEVDTVTGFAVTAGSSTTVAATIHGDHMFFNGFPEGSEANVTRLAQWLADSDLNVDGEVTRAELEQLSTSDLAEFDTRYSLGGSPIMLTNLWTYVQAQLKTQGHFQGEGECPADGTGHSHGGA